VFQKTRIHDVRRLLKNVQRLGARDGETGGVQFEYVEDLDGFDEVHMGIL
jgi:hypothetical protein